jgi:DNA-binding HxlR family transcriptional regulator
LSNAIILSLFFGNKRFSQISNEVTGISDRILAKELKDLELNKLIKRTIYDTFAPTVEYSITDHCRKVEQTLIDLKTFGYLHRKEVIGK